MTETHIVANKVLLTEVCNALLEGKKVRLRSRGDSMRPFIRDVVDVIILAPVGRLRKGNIVLARIDGDNFVIHRIVNFSKDKVILAGDANLFVEEICDRKEVYGIAEGILRDGKEYSLISYKSVLLAYVWRLTLPLRRLTYKWVNHTA